ncbi:YgdI/YgdR family lipoprotein [Pseudomonas sp. N040]|uniref:YgdI/YgdR family lipoprotein n=1 Tax=Pseudomonas sp. N040 TaxID=2785325 RepID=UPI0018A2E706|nr:YgdI/YgdR family lipoprotein [Pseudomonas sp. N040]MBF7730738.1 YgdI/YgdR family lipoprotein [Pseudomonas sp. N040]MBW7014381.1 YgdI/YgdR family lipoprotein [Pseudomonas sp. N040]
MRKLILAACCVLSLTACSHEYIISTTDGQLITTSSKPKLDEKTGMYRFEDGEGRDQQVEKTSVKQILER